jgi:hypothetical protein
MTGAHDPINLFFGPVFGTAISNLERTATAVLAPAQGSLILILDPTLSGALQLNGTVLMTVAGKIHVNSDNACGVLLNGQPFKVQAVQTSVVGGACYHDGTIAGAVIEGADIEEDPLAHLLTDSASWDAFKTAMPQPLGPNGQISTPDTYGPGHYPQGLSLASSDQVTLLPGHYMLGGAGVTLHGSSFITGDDVTLFIDQGATVDISGSGAGASLTATKSGDYQGIAFFHHRQNGPGVQSKITGGGLFQVQGLIYVPGGELVMGGNPGKEIGAIIVNTLSNAGVTGFTITGKGIPPSEGDEYTYLVE